MGSSSTSSGSVPVLRCPVLFDGTNYRDWVPRLLLQVKTRSNDSLERYKAHLVARGF
jgi:hypothetical protein